MAIASRFVAYKDLSKITLVPEQYSGPVVAWSLLPEESALDASNVIVLTLLLATEIAILAATVALDDIQGARDGNDSYNYLASHSRGLRKLSVKPLLQGRLNEHQASRFAHAMALTALGTGTAAHAVAGFRPSWAYPVSLLLFFLTLQYSAGAKFSYWGAGEVLLWLSTGCGVLIPAVLALGGTRGDAAVQSILFGMWMLQVSVFSNTFDAVGDARVGRRTLAVRVSDRVNRALIVTLFLVHWAVVATASASDLLSVWHVAALTPAILLQVRQLDLGIRRRDPLAARKIGLTVYRLAVFSIVAANVAVNWS